MSDKMREEFEAWVSNTLKSRFFGTLMVVEDGKYRHEDIQTAWQAWQASAALRTHEKESEAGAVAEVCSTFELRWIGSESIKAIADRTGVKVSDKLYLAPQSAHAIEAAALIQGAETAKELMMHGAHGFRGPQHVHAAILALIPQDGRTQLGEFGKQSRKEALLEAAERFGANNGEWIGPDIAYQLRRMAEGEK